MKGKGSGAFEEKGTIYNGVALRAVKWHGNRAATLLSTFASTNPTATVMRWDNKRKTAVQMKCKSIDTAYNKMMGGFDLLDSLILLYRTKIQSKKCYHRVVLCMLDLAVVETWLLFRRDSRDYNVAQKHEFSLSKFKAEVAACLCTEKKTLRRRRPLHHSEKHQSTK